MTVTAAPTAPLGPVREAGRAVLSTVRPLGWSVTGAGVVSWIAGALLGWAELLTIGAACLLLVILAAFLTAGSLRLDVDLHVEPQRVTAGKSARARVTIRKLRLGGLLPASLEIPVGISREPMALPRVARGASVEKDFLVATTRRGVIAIGPATAVRADPIGLLRRTATGGPVRELCVHPITVALDHLGAGLLRDLEGTTTTQVSLSDLAFHALREYSPGDDRRHIHWRSSARIESLGDSNTLMVRQFLDTRRSHVSVVVDGRPGSYLDPVDFETAISAAASLVRQTITDRMPTTVVVSQQSAHMVGLHVAMDAFARAEPCPASLTSLAREAFRLAPDTSVALFVTGATPEVGELRRAASHFGSDVRQVAIQIDPTRDGDIRPFDTMTVVKLPRLSSLPAVVKRFVT